MTRSIWIPALLIVAIPALAPPLWRPWALSEDAETIRRAREIVSAARAGDVRGAIRPFREEESGRVRPVYWLAVTARWLIAGESAPAAHLCLVLVALAAAVGLGLAARAATGSGLAAWLAGACLLWGPGHSTWSSLAPSEPLAVLGFALSWAGLIGLAGGASGRGRLRAAALAVVGAPLAYGAKEPGVVGVLVPIAAFLVSLRPGGDGASRRLMVALVLWHLGLAGAVAVAARPSQHAAGAYTAHFGGGLNWGYWGVYRHMLTAVYGPLLSLAFLSALVRLGRGWFHRHDHDAHGLEGAGWSSLGAAVSACYMGILLRWQLAAVDRYLLPVVPGVALMIGIEAAWWWRTAARAAARDGRVRWAGRAAQLAILVLGWPWTWSVYGVVNQTSLFGIGDVTDGVLAERLARLPAGAMVVALGRPESAQFIYELPTHLAYVYRRPDMRVIGDTNPERPPLRPGDAVVVGPSWGVSRRAPFASLVRSTLADLRSRVVPGAGFGAAEWWQGGYWAEGRAADITGTGEAERLWVILPVVAGRGVPHPEDVVWAGDLLAGQPLNTAAGGRPPDGWSMTVGAGGPAAVTRVPWAFLRRSVEIPGGGLYEVQVEAEATPDSRGEDTLVLGLAAEDGHGREVFNFHYRTRSPAGGNVAAGLFRLPDGARRATAVVAKRLNDGTPVTVRRVGLRRVPGGWPTIGGYAAGVVKAHPVPFVMLGTGWLAVLGALTRDIAGRAKEG